MNAEQFVIAALISDLNMLKKQNADYLAMLKKLEWVGWDHGYEQETCPCCGTWEKYGKHAPGCKLAKLIGSPMEEVE
jgi:hypothetical protein